MTKCSCDGPILEDHMGSFLKPVSTQISPWNLFSNPFWFFQFASQMEKIYGQNSY